MRSAHACTVGMLYRAGCAEQLRRFRARPASLARSPAVESGPVRAVYLTLTGLLAIHDTIARTFHLAQADSFADHATLGTHTGSAGGNIAAIVVAVVATIGGAAGAALAGDVAVILALRGAMSPTSAVVIAVVAAHG